MRPDADVLELGAGWCDFSNYVKARRVVAMDLDATVAAGRRAPRRGRVGDCTDLSRFDEDSFDVVFAATCSSTSTGSSRPASWPAQRGCCVPADD